MKKLMVLFTMLSFVVLSLQANAQSKTGADYFVGKWSILMKGTPLGDLKRLYILEKKDSMLTGVVQDTTGQEIARFSKVELKEDQITVYYSARGYDLNVTLAKKDEDHTAGTVNGMYDVEGERMK